MNIGSHVGEYAALLTTVFWTITALAFEASSKRIGSLNLNLLRLGLAFILLSCFTLIRRGMPFPSDAAPHQWQWLALSGIVGFVIGDFCLFRAFILIGARISMLLMTLAPIIAALAGWIFLDDTISMLGVLGMAITVSGIALVIFVKNPADSRPNAVQKNALPAHFTQGVILAFIAAIGQGVGLVLSKHGMLQYDPFSSAQIRVIAGFLGFAILFTVLGRWKEIPVALKDSKAMVWLAVGSVFGPFLGVSFSMIAVQHTNAGIAQTIMSLVPIFIIPPTILLKGEKPGFREILGAIMAVSGIALFFL